MLKRAMKLKPMGIGQHGVSTNKFWDAGTFDKSLDYLKRIRDTGAMVGLSCHNPLEVEYAEEHGWDVDYYMTSLYYMIRPRAEFEKLLGGQLPLGEVYLPADPPRMLEAIRKAKKPCLAFKILAAGRTVDSPQQVKERMAVARSEILTCPPIHRACWKPSVRRRSRAWRLRFWPRGAPSIRRSR